MEEIHLTVLQTVLMSILIVLAIFCLFTKLMNTRKMDLKGKVVLITGASSGIGEGLVHEFARAGCKIVMAARRVDRLESLHLHLIEKYQISFEDIFTLYLDVGDVAGIKQAVHLILNKFGHVDILINNAGIGMKDSVLDTSMEAYKTVFDVNFLGPVTLVKEFLPSMIERREGCIVAVSSLMGRVSVPYSSAYGCSKHALQAFHDSLRAETCSKNIHVLVASPGFVKTDIDLAMYSGDLSQKQERYKTVQQGVSSESCAQSIVDAVRNYDSEISIGPFIHRIVPITRALFPGYLSKTLAKLGRKVLY